MPDAVFVCADGRVTYANPAAASLLAVEPEAVRGREFVDLVPAVDRDSVGRALETAGADGRSEPVETALQRAVIRNADGGAEPAETTASDRVASDPAPSDEASADASDTASTDTAPEPLIDPLVDPGGPVPVELTAIDAGDGEVQVVAHDLRQRLERQKRLALYRRAMDEATVGITIADHTAGDEGLIYANEEFKRLSGLDDGDLIGHNPRMLQTDATDPEPVARLRRTIDAGEEASVVLLNRRSDGRKWYNALDISPIRGPNWEISHYLGFQRDVTDWVSREQRLTVLDRVLRHNIRNRLNVVLGYADRAERAVGADESAADPLVPDADELRDAIDRIREAATDILDLSDSARRFRENVGGDGNGDPVGAATVVVDVASALAAEGPDADVLVPTPEESVSVAGAAPLSLVVDELLSNALEHVDDPTVCVSLSVEDEEVALRVADDGSGITADSRAPLESGAETPTEHGQGVGLWLVRWTIDAVGGTVGYEEGSDGGTAVTARFPIVDDARTAE